MDQKTLITEYLSRKHIMQLATVKDSKPWICSVHYAFDQEGNLYWMSMRNSRHSSEVRANKEAAVAILIDEEKKQCIHMEGEAFELTNEDAKHAHIIYTERFGANDERLAEALSEDTHSRAYYRFKATHRYWVDMMSSDNPKQEIS